MNRGELEKINESFIQNEARLKALQPGDFIYELETQDPFGNSYFKHEVVSVDLYEMCVNTLDWSQNKKPGVLYGFGLHSEIFGNDPDE